MNYSKMCAEYSRCWQNLLSSSASARIAELDALAAAEGLRFVMTNASQYGLAHYLGAPRFALVPV